MAPVFSRLETPSRGGRSASRRRPERAACSSRRESTSRRSRRSSTRATPTSLRLLPRLCVSSEGAVDSIQLVSTTPLDADPHGRGHAGERHLGRARRRCCCRDATHVPLGEEADAKLLIGDAALRSRVRGSDAAPRPRPALARAHRPADGVRRLGRARAARRRRSPSSRTRSSRRCGSPARSRSVLAHEASERYGYPAGFLARYFEKLRYRFGPRERAGLYTFLELARDVGELDDVPELRFVTRGRRWRRDGGRDPHRRARSSSKALDGERITDAEALALLESRDLVAGRPRRRTSSAAAAPIPTGSRSSSTATSTTRTSASPTATSAPSTAARATAARATCCRSR